MTHPPSGPSQPPRPSGPRDRDPEALDPETPEGKAAADAISEALAEIQLAILRRKNSSKRHGTDAA